MSFPFKKYPKKLYAAVIYGAMFLIGSLAVLLIQPFRTIVNSSIETSLAHTFKEPEEQFPDIPTDDLSDIQKRIVDLAKTEYAKKPVSFDENVLRYSDGVREAWCANFASWILREAGLPLKNPHSGSWRIPGVYTMDEFYKSAGKYRPAGSYTPKPGDIAIYLDDGRMHVNIVLAVKASNMTTIGGNESGHLRLNTQAFTRGTEQLSGFGIL